MAEIPQWEKPRNMTDTVEMAFHRRLFNVIDDMDSDVGGVGDAVRALLAVIWIHCPVQWRNAVSSGEPLALSDGLCHTCRVRYPCRNITAIADEFGITRVAP